MILLMRVLQPEVRRREQSQARCRGNATIELWLEFCCAHAKLLPAPIRNLPMLWVIQLQNLASVMSECLVGGVVRLT